MLYKHLHLRFSGILKWNCWVLVATPGFIVPLRFFTLLSTVGEDLLSSCSHQHSLVFKIHLTSSSSEDEVVSWVVCFVSLVTTDVTGIFVCLLYICVSVVIRLFRVSIVDTSLLLEIRFTMFFCGLSFSLGNVPQSCNRVLLCRLGWPALCHIIQTGPKLSIFLH